MPSQRGLAPGGAGKATTSRSGRAVVKSLREDDDDEDGDGDEGSQVLRREGICGLLYSKDDLTPRMAGQLREVHVHRDFKMPAQDPAKVQFFDPDRGRKALGMTKPGASRPRAQMLLPLPAPGAGKEEEDEDFEYEPLVLWEPPPDAEGEADRGKADGEAAGEAGGEAAGDGAVEGDATAKPKEKVEPISVDKKLCRWLRSHQREGTQFLFNCLMGLRDFDGCGCILADDMGLGKTLQSITILWTLMCQGFEGKPAVTHTIIACPVSLVTNWESEVRPRTARAPACAMVSHTWRACSQEAPHSLRSCVRASTSRVSDQDQVDWPGARQGSAH